MGWLVDDFWEDHEGYLQAVVRDAGDLHWRELRFGDVAQPVDFVQVACACGWRSQRYPVAILGAEWFPCAVTFRRHDEQMDTAGSEVWMQHIESVRAAERGLTERARQLALDEILGHSR